MWLDRLSGHTTPAATPSASPPPVASRPYSPAPRRSGHLGPQSAVQRSGFNPRSSSLSLHSNDSTTSLLSSSKRPNGSTLKQSVIAEDVPSPLAVLESLLGAEGKEQANAVKAQHGVNGFGTDDEDFENELDFEGLSLREFASRSFPPTPEGYVNTTQSIEECMFTSWVSCSYANLDSS